MNSCRGMSLTCMFVFLYRCVPVIFHFARQDGVGLQYERAAATWWAVTWQRENKLVGWCSHPWMEVGGVGEGYCWGSAGVCVSTLGCKEQRSGFLGAPLPIFQMHFFALTRKSAWYTSRIQQVLAKSANPLSFHRVQRLQRRLVLYPGFVWSLDGIDGNIAFCLTCLWDVVFVRHSWLV